MVIETDRQKLRHGLAKFCDLIGPRFMLKYRYSPTSEIDEWSKSNIKQRTMKNEQQRMSLSSYSLLDRLFHFLS